MRALLLSWLMMASTGVLAQEVNPPSEKPGNGVMLALSVFQTSWITSFLGTQQSGSGSTGNAPFAGPLQPAVSFGGLFGQEAILLGFGFGAAGASSEQDNGGGGFLFTISPTFRHYFEPLVKGGFSPFMEGSVAVEVVAPSATPASFAFGADLGGGGEWLFTKNFGLFGRVTLAYQHANFGYNVDAAGLTGDAGLTVHL